MSARAFKQNDIEKVKRICKQYPESHGSPLDETADELGIDVSKTDFGDPLMYPEGEDVKVLFWPCGVTP